MVNMEKGDPRAAGGSAGRGRFFPVEVLMWVYLEFDQGGRLEYWEHEM